MWQERVRRVDDVVASENDAGRARLFERPMERQTLQIMRVRDSREDDMADSRIDEV